MDYSYSSNRRQPEPNTALHIVVCDNDVESIRATLESKGCRLETVEENIRCLSKSLYEGVDLLLIEDHQNTTQDTTITKAINSLVPTTYRPIQFVTVDDKGKASKILNQESDIDGVIVKPFDKYDMKQLVTLVKKCHRIDSDLASSCHLSNKIMFTH